MTDTAEHPKAAYEIAREIAEVAADRPPAEWTRDTAAAVAVEILGAAVDSREATVEKARQTTGFYVEHLALLEANEFKLPEAALADLIAGAKASQESAIVWLAHQEALLADGVASLVPDSDLVDVPAWVLRELIGAAHPTAAERYEYQFMWERERQQA